MANQSEMLRRLRTLYTPMPRSSLERSNRAEACAEYWRQLTATQQNAVALLNRDATIWKAAWDLGGPFQAVQNAYQSGYATGQQDALAASQFAAALASDPNGEECYDCDQ